LRNQNYFKIYDFDEGRVVEPDFLMFLNKINREISIYQIFIEAKGNQFKDSNGLFENSKEGWKEKIFISNRTKN
jgi:type III restriction enzyme